MISLFSTELEEFETGCPSNWNTSFGVVTGVKISSISYSFPLGSNHLNYIFNSILDHIIRLVYDQI